MARPIPDVSVRDGPDGGFHVEVRSGATTTTHEVAVPEGYPAEIGCGHASGAELVAASFAFLLEREPATSILGRFSLDVIERYFPAYRSEIARHSGRR
jgi:hypothetical protein